jgi:hypothetical protein
VKGKKRSLPGTRRDSFFLRSLRSFAAILSSPFYLCGFAPLREIFLPARILENLTQRFGTY